MTEVTYLDDYRNKSTPEGQAPFYSGELVSLHASDLPDLSKIAHDLAASAEDYRKHPNEYDQARMETYAQDEDTPAVVKSLGALTTTVGPEISQNYAEKPANTPQQYVYGIGERITMLRETRKAA